MAQLSPVETARSAVRSFSRVMAFLCDDVTRQAVLRIAADSGWRQPLVEQGGIGAAIEHLTGGLSPELLFVDLSESANPLSDVNALADVCDPGTKVIAFGAVNDVKLYRGLVSSGLVDYLPKPATPADILRAIAEAAGTAAESRNERRGKLMIVTGARGGGGASMLATGMAWVAAEKCDIKTALLDLDLRFGTSALTFDAEPGNGVSDMLSDPDRIDPLFLERASIMVGQRLALFATEAPLTEVKPPRPDAVRVLADELLCSYDWVIADMPRDVLVGQLDLISVAEKLVLVSDLSLASMRDCLRLRALMSEHGSQARIELICNEPRPSSKGDLPRAEFEKALGQRFALHLPFDHKSVADAEGRALPIAAAAGKLAAAIGGFAKDVFAPAPEAVVKKPSWGIRLSMGGKK